MEKALSNDQNSRISFELIETLTREASLKAGAIVIENLLNDDTSDCQPEIIHPNGTKMKYSGRRERTVVTVLGDITIKRAYYTDGNGQGYCPRDRMLGLDKDCLSDGVKRIIGHSASVLSFSESSQMIEALSGLHIGPKQVERAAEALGKEISEDERVEIKEGEPCSQTMYAGMDGSGCPMRKEETEGRKGKQKDGSSKTREVKLAVFMSADGLGKDGIPQRDIGSVSYNAAIESARSNDLEKERSAFAQRIEREACRRGFYKAKRQVIIGDGAPWIWNIATESFPDAIQIIDLYHAKGTISTAGKEIFGTDNDFEKVWSKECRDFLEAGKIDTIIGKIEAHEATCDAARKCKDYLIKNRKRLDYPKFRKMGLCTSSGIVESGCKHVIGARVKQSGMHWTVAGANAIIALRCSKLNGHFDNFMDRRKAA